MEADLLDGAGSNRLILALAQEIGRANLTDAEGLAYSDVDRQGQLTERDLVGERYVGPCRAS